MKRDNQFIFPRRRNGGNDDVIRISRISPRRHDVRKFVVFPFFGRPWTSAKSAKFCLSKNSLAFPFRNIQVCFLLFAEESIHFCVKTVKEKWKLVNSSLAATSTGNLVFKGRTCELAVTFQNSAETTTRSLLLN